jgi:hypothetical protein
VSSCLVSPGASPRDWKRIVTRDTVAKIGISVWAFAVLNLVLHTRRKRSVPERGVPVPTPPGATSRASSRAAVADPHTERGGESPAVDHPGVASIRSRSIAPRSDDLRWPTVLAASGLLAVLVTVTVRAVASAEVFLTADMGHYLADADALGGDGVRDIRHLPAYPAVVLGLRQVFTRLVTIEAAAVVIVASLFGAGFLMLRQRTRRPASAAIGAFVLAASPVVAEGVAWGGGAMLVGLACALVAIHFLDETLERHSRRSAAFAGVAAGLTIASHALPATVLAASAAWICTRSLLRLRQTSRRAALRSAGLLTIVVGCALLAVLLNIGLYRDLEQPTTIDPDLGRLALIWQWGFRDLWVMWLALIMLGTVAVAFDPYASLGIRRLGRWASVMTVLTITQTALLGGDPSYTTRALYVLCFPAAIGAAWLSDRLLGLVHRSSGRPQRVAIASVVLLLVATTWSFQHRIDVAVPYYNRVDRPELAAIEWLASDHPGTVVVSAKGANLDDGTLYSWMVEGLAHARAIGPGRPFLYLLRRAADDSLDAERFLAGTSIVEVGALRVGVNESATIASVQVRAEGAWIPVFQVRPRQAESGASDSHTPVTLIDMANGLNVTPSRDGATTMSLRLPSDVEQLEVAPSPLLPVRMETANEANRFTVTTGAGPIAVVVSGIDASPRQVTDPRTGAVSLSMHRDVAQPRDVALTISGADAAVQDVRHYDEAQLAQAQHITHVMTWNDSNEFSDLAQRSCLEQAYANAEVTIWRVKPACHA